MKDNTDVSFFLFPRQENPPFRGRGAPQPRQLRGRARMSGDRDETPAPRKRRSGRGTDSNPPNRFERIAYEADEEWEGEAPRSETRFYRDNGKTIIATNDSPDIGFEASINPYRGCEHGCTYCYARPFHEYLGFSSGLDFETRIMVKENAATLLRKELLRPSWVPKPLELSGVTDPYQPVERRLRITRSLLEVLEEFRNPVQLITKNHLVTRDIDLLASLARDNAAAVVLSITTLDADLARRLEPRTSTPQRRLDAMEELHRAGIPVGLSVSPVIPALTDEEMPAIIAEAAKRGAGFAFFIPLRLPRAVEQLFDAWLLEHYPLRREKILHRLASMREGKVNEARFGKRMTGSGPMYEQLRTLFHLACARHGLARSGAVLSTAAFRRPDSTAQIALFE